MSFQVQVYVKVNKEGLEEETHEKMLIETDQLNWSTAKQVSDNARDLYIRACNHWNAPVAGPVGEVWNYLPAGAER